MNMWYVVNGELEYVSSDYLYHHGVKGMKWGVRKRISDVFDGMRKRVKKSKVVRQVKNSKAGKEIRERHNDWKHERSARAEATMERYGGNKKKAIAATAAANFGSAAAVSAGGMIAARLLTGTMNRSWARVGAAVNVGAQTAAAVLAINGAVKVADLARRP